MRKQFTFILLFTAMVSSAFFGFAFAEDAKNTSTKPSASEPAATTPETPAVSPEQLAKIDDFKKQLKETQATLNKLRQDVTSNKETKHRLTEEIKILESVLRKLDNSQ